MTDPDTMTKAQLVAEAARLGLGSKAALDAQHKDTVRASVKSERARNA